MKKITSVKKLALALDKSPVDIDLIGAGLNKRVTLWLKRREVAVIDGKLTLTKEQK